ncbi:MAG: hypothetical protein J5I53_07285 [Bradyrhizobiaceae bacterium]|nr:hypothetical protein [Bradyrhizobiaceae bacterium]
MKRLLLGVCLLFLLVGTLNVKACPACKDGYAAGSKQAAIGESYSISVLFMLGVPFTIVTVAGVAYVRHMKRIKKNELN